MLKAELRQQMRHIKRQFTQQQLDELSLPIISRLKERLCDAQVILAYYSLPDEVNTHQLIDDLVAEGKTVLLPKVIDNETMVLRRYTGEASLSEGAFHIMEPIGEPFTAYEQIDIALIPGVAFDAYGHRLGRGKGYYDRFLRTMVRTMGARTMGTVPSVSSEADYRGTVPSVRTVGVCFDFQKVSEVPVDAYDIPVDEVI